MYRCEICQAVTPPGQPRLVHAVTRTVPRVSCNPKAPPTRTEIARELAVCSDCQFQLLLGLPLATVIRRRGKPRQIPPPQSPGWSPKPPPPLRKATPLPTLELPGARLTYIQPEQAPEAPSPVKLPGKRVGGGKKK